MIVQIKIINLKILQIEVYVLAKNELQRCFQCAHIAFGKWCLSYSHWEVKLAFLWASDFLLQVKKSEQGRSHRGGEGSTGSKRFPVFSALNPFICFSRSLFVLFLSLVLKILSQISQKTSVTSSVKSRWPEWSSKRSKVTSENNNL